MSMDDEVRHRFHDQANRMHKLEARLLMAEGEITVLKRDTSRMATVQQMDSFTELVNQKLDQIRSDFGPVRHAVYGLITLIVTGFIAALVAGVWKP